MAMRALGVEISVKKSVGQFLFDGYADPLLDLAKLIPSAIVPVTIPFDKFGWFYTVSESAFSNLIPRILTYFLSISREMVPPPTTAYLTCTPVSETSPNSVLWENGIMRIRHNFILLTAPV